MKFIKDYKNDDNYRLSFNKLAMTTFGIDFEPWYKKGFWNDRYICYSYAEEDKIISNISVNRLDIMWQGQEKSAIQLGTVMTHAEYRNKGLASRLMKIILEEYKNIDFIYLFSNDNALNFYERFGFKPLVQSEFSAIVNADKLKSKKLKKLNILNKDDLNLMSRLFKHRAYISDRLGVTNDGQLIFFHCLYGLSNHIYYLEESDTIVIFTINKDRLDLYDVISQDNIDLDNIISEIAPPEIKKVNFYFTPDLKSIKPDIHELREEDSTLLVKPLIEIKDKICFPYTSEA